jgi:myosin-crossreactive antigen
MPVIGSVGSSRRKSDKPGTAVVWSSPCSVNRAMLLPRVLIADSMVFISIFSINILNHSLYILLEYYLPPCCLTTIIQFFGASGKK